MSCFSRNVLAVMLLFCAAPLFAQTQEQPSYNPQPTVEPPSPTSSAKDLESRGDTLRAEKDYLNAIDYYLAALKKNDSGVLHNKLGVAELQSIVERLGKVFASEFSRDAHMDVIFTNEDREADLRRVCRPFYERGSDSAVSPNS